MTSILITTRNRVDELRRTLLVLQSLDPPPHEILITADGCSDDTAAVVRALAPSAILIENPASIGSVASRDAMLRRATGDLALMLDDDSHPEQPDCLATLDTLFAARPRLAVATFPQRTDEYPATLTQSDFGLEKPVRSFANSGACLRVATYRALPGFEPMFGHMYEEPDYALQCIAAGWDICFIPDITIRHHWTPNQRSEIRNHHRHARNELWSTLIRCPFPLVLALIPYRILSQARYAATRGPAWLVREPAWWLHALAGCPRAIRKRNPVTRTQYRRWLRGATSVVRSRS
jgi:GT2 family glycosyltransferase